MEHLNFVKKYKKALTGIEPAIFGFEGRCDTISPQDHSIFKNLAIYITTVIKRLLKRSKFQVYLSWLDLNDDFIFIKT